MTIGVSALVSSIDQFCETNCQGTKFSRRGIDACPASFRAIISAVVYHDGCFRRWISARRTVNSADTSFVRINNIAEIGINGAPL